MLKFQCSEFFNSNYTIGILEIFSIEVVPIENLFGEY